MAARSGAVTGRGQPDGPVGPAGGATSGDGALRPDDPGAPAGGATSGDGALRPDGPVGGDPADGDLAGRLVARCRFPAAGQPVVCAVSGGADSLALLVLAVAAGCRVTAVHVDHRLRPGSASEADVVRDAARRFGAGFRAVRVEVAPGPNLEARARAARRAALGPDAATGHTMDDQAETILLNVLRGAAADGLRGMRPGPRHPLLDLRRAETRALCSAAGLEPVHDPSNDDLRFLRNRVRHQLLPLCQAIAGRDIVPVLARQAVLLADDTALLTAAAAAVDPTDARSVADHPPALARRAVRRWLQGTDEHPPDLASVERVLAVARGAARATEVAGGRRVARSGMRLTLHGPTTGSHRREPPGAVGVPRPADAHDAPVPPPDPAPPGDLVSAGGWVQPGDLVPPPDPVPPGDLVLPGNPVERVR